MGGRVIINLGKLDNIQDQLSQKYIARVGILSSKSHKGAKGSVIDMATLAIIHIFGSLSRNIPPRDFLFMPLICKKIDIMKVISSKKVSEAIMQGDIKKALKLIGAKGEEIVQEAFATRGFGLWPALKSATIKRKGSDAPLINTSALRRSVTSDVVKK